MRWRYKGRHRANRHSVRVADLQAQAITERAGLLGHTQMVFAGGLLETFLGGAR